MKDLGVKTTCARCEKKKFGKCLDGTGGFYGCGKDDHKVKDCPSISPRG